MLSFPLFLALVASTLSSFVLALPLNDKIVKRTAGGKVAVYYGQGNGQKQLSAYCDDPNIDIISIGFVNSFPNQNGNNGWPTVDFGNQCGGPKYNGTNTYMSCLYLKDDVQTCQNKGKQILISIGGDSSSSYSLNNDQEGIDFATQLWKMFGPKPDKFSGPRPFGDSVVDGFDFDIEKNGNVGYGAMAKTLRTYMDNDTTKSGYLLTAAPQCVIPDAQLSTAVMQARFDYLFVQFYNTRQCSARAHLDNTYGSELVGGAKTDISFTQWANWITKNAAGPVKPEIFIGLPGSPDALVDDTMYLNKDETTQLLKDFYAHPSFGGIMIWEATTAEQNNNFVAQAKQALSDCRGVVTTSTTSSSTTSTTTSSSTSSTSTTTTPTPSSPSSTSTTTTQSTSMSGPTFTPTFTGPTPPFSIPTTSTSATSSTTSPTTTSPTTTSPTSSTTPSKPISIPTVIPTTISEPSTTKPTDSTSTTTVTDTKTNLSGTTTITYTSPSTKDTTTSPTTTLSDTTTPGDTSTTSPHHPDDSTKTTLEISTTTPTSYPGPGVTWEPWTTMSTTSSRPVDPTTSSEASSWAPWPTSSSWSWDPSSIERIWASWSTTAKDPESNTWASWSTTGPIVYVTTTSTVYTDVCPTGYTKVTATITATVTMTDFATPPGGNDAPWPTGPAGLPTGFYAATTVCSVGCGSKPVTVIVTIPVPSGGITKTVSPTAADTAKPSSDGGYSAADTGKPELGTEATSTPAAATSGWSPAAASTSSADSAWVTGNPIGGYPGSSNGNGIKPFTGGAAAEQAPATALSVAMCVVLALAGLIL